MNLNEYLKNNKNFYMNELYVDYDMLMEYAEEQIHYENEDLTSFDFSAIELFEVDDSTGWIGNKIDFDLEDIEFLKESIMEEWKEGEHVMIWSW